MYGEKCVIRKGLQQHCRNVRVVQSRLRSTLYKQWNRLDGHIRFGNEILRIQYRPNGEIAANQLDFRFGKLPIVRCYCHYVSIAIDCYQCGRRFEFVQLRSGYISDTGNGWSSGADKQLPRNDSEGAEMCE